MAEPKVRFKRDDGCDFPKWENATLGELGTFTKGATLSKADISETGNPLILYGELYTTYAEVAYDIVRSTQAIVDKRHVSCLGDVVIPTSGESPEEISTATCVMRDGVILAGDLNIYRSAIVDGRIMSYILNHQINRDIANIAQGKSIVHIQAKELQKIKCWFPVSIEEQHLIADFMSSVDEVIAESKREIANLEMQKKTVMKKIFSQEVRFKQADGSNFPEWKDVHFGNIFTEIVRRTSDTETYPLYSLTIEDGVTAKTERYERSYLVKKTEDNYKIVPPNAFVYNPMNLRFGALAPSHEKKEVCVSQYYNVFSLDDETTLGFWENYLVSDAMLQYYFSIATGSLVEKLRVHYSSFVNIVKPIPCAEEQRFIAGFLYDFDEAIAAAKRELELWKDLKKGLLQQMFV